jgi:hypothetical protein
MSMKNSSDIMGNRNSDLPACSAVPQPTAPPCAPRCGWLGGVAAATPKNPPQRFILTDYFINYNFSKAQIIRSLMMVIEPKHVGAVLI